MNIIEEFMKRYQQLVEDHEAGRISDEEYAANLISMTSQAMGLGRRVRSKHLKVLAGMIFTAVDQERTAAASRCIQSLDVHVDRDVGYPIASVRELAYRVRSAVHSVLTSRHQAIPESDYPTMAVAQRTDDGIRIFMKRSESGHTIYSFRIGKTCTGIGMRDSVEFIATDYLLRKNRGTYV